METVQWIVAAGTAIFVALVGFFQWRTAQQKAALDRRIDAIIGEPVTFALEKNAIYIKDAKGKEHKVSVTKKTAKPIER